MSKHVISTLSRNTRYADWTRNSGLNGIKHSVLVKGGAGIVPRLVSGVAVLQAPQATRTEVSDADAEFLANHPDFKRHMARGFVRFVSKPIDPESAGRSMPKDEGSRPRTRDDVAKSQPPAQLDVEKTTVTTNRK